MSFRALLRCLAALLLFVPSSAWAEARLAMVVGVDDYELFELSYPVADAELVDAKLQQVGFETTLLHNPSQGELRVAVQEFAEQLREAGPESTALFYFSGHGVQIDGENYLIPGRSPLLARQSGVGASLTKAGVLDLAINAQTGVLSHLVGSGVARLIFVLDACRDNPFPESSRGIVRVGGLQSMASPTGATEVFYFFAAEPEKVAYDGGAGAGNSPFTEALARSVVAPGSNLETVYRQVRSSVLLTTNQQQRPYQEGVLFEFYFVEVQRRRENESGGLETGLREHDYEQSDDGELLLRAALNVRSMEEIREAAEAGDAEALYLVAVSYHSGLGVEADGEEALRWYRRAASRGFPRAQMIYGERLIEGHHVEQNVEEGLEWLHIAADNGSLDALTQLGHLYRHGEVVEKDLYKAAAYYTLPLEQGFAWAQFGQSWVLLSRAAEQEDAEVAELLRAQSTELMRAAAAQGKLNAQDIVGDRYRWGTGVEVDLHEAARWYELAARRGHTASAKSLASLLQSGALGEPNPARAAAVLEVAGEQGSGEALHLLAIELLAGRVPGRTPAEGFEFAQRAADLGWLPAMEEVARTMIEGEHVPKNVPGGVDLALEALAALEQLPLDSEQAWPPELLSLAWLLIKAGEAHDLAQLGEAQVQALRAKYGDPGGGLKKFTVPIDCGLSARTPFDIYIWQSDNEESMVDAQAAWIEQARGCTVPEEVLESFTKMRALAKKNNVSFPDLCVYALEVANEEKAEAAKESEAISP